VYILDTTTCDEGSEQAVYTADHAVQCLLCLPVILLMVSICACSYCFVFDNVSTLLHAVV